MTRILIRGMKSPFEAISAERTLDEDINGGNSGNLIFLESAYKLLSTRDAEITVDHFHPEWIGADVINERFDVFVIPFANAFRPAFRPTLERYTETIERLKIPVVVLSCGYQAKLPYAPASRTPSTTSRGGSCGPCWIGPRRSVPAVSTPRTTCDGSASTTSRSSAARRCSSTARA